MQFPLNEKDPCTWFALVVSGLIATVVITNQTDVLDLESGLWLAITGIALVVYTFVLLVVCTLFNHILLRLKKKLGTLD